MIAKDEAIYHHPQTYNIDTQSTLEQFQMQFDFKAMGFLACGTG